jgi:hypothetical protein
MEVVRQYHEGMMMTMNKKDYCVRKAFIDMQRAADKLGVYRHQAADRKDSSSNSNSGSRKIVDLKTGKTRAKEEYEKTVRLLNLMKGAR